MTTPGIDQPRLNPFAFVSDTSLRFAQLLVLVTCGSARHWFSVAFGISGSGTQFENCVKERSVDVRELFSSELARQAEIACQKLIGSNHALTYIAGGLVLLACATMLIYRMYPIWIIRRYRLQRLDPAEDAALATALQSLCQVTKLNPAPEFWWNPIDGSNTALAFGSDRHCRIALSGKYAALHDTDPTTFRTVLLHEFAHLRNKDVTVTYLAMAVWWAFIVTALVPSTVVLLIQRPAMADYAITIAEVGAFTMCALLTRNAVLRARELYADARSLTWHTDTSELSSVFRKLLPVPRFLRLLSPHPDPRKRQRLLTNTDEMFSFGAWDAFGIGVSAGIICMFLMFVILSAASENPALLFVTVTLCIPLAAGAVAIGVWRSAFVALMRGRRRAPVLRVSGAVTAGGLAGSVVMPAIAFTTVAAGLGGADPELLKLGAIGPGVVIASFVVIFLMIMLLLTLIIVAMLSWIETTARCWLMASLSSKSPPGIEFVISIVCVFFAIALVLVLPLMGIGTAMALQEDRTSQSVPLIGYLWATSQIFPINLLAWAGIIGLWATPLSAALWSRGENVGAWVFLDALPPGKSEFPAELFRLRLGVLAGLAGGIIAVVAVHLPQLAPADAAMNFHALELRSLSGIVVQGFVAVLMTFATPRFALPHALFAAFIAGCLFSIGEVLSLHFVLGGRTSVVVLASVVSSFVVLGGVPVVVLCVLIARPFAPVFQRFVARAS